MFTLKFCNNYENGDSRTTVVSCIHYSVYKFKDLTEVTLYKDYTTTEGVCYTVSSKELEIPHFDVCYVENVNGKTIDRI